MDEEVEVRLPWQTICALACKALIAGVSLNDLCVWAIDNYIASGPKAKGE